MFISCIFSVGFVVKGGGMVVGGMVVGVVVVADVKI